MTPVEEEKTEEEKEEEVTPTAQRPRLSLPAHIFAVAARNRKNRFFIPSKENRFAGIPYDFVRVDSGCNSFLLPFKAQVMAMFREQRFMWSVNISRRAGAMKSPTLVIQRNDDASLGQLSLAGSGPLMDLKRLRFHLGSESVRVLLAGNNGKLSEDDLQTLRYCLTNMGNVVSPERHHAILGQTYLQEVLSMQLGNFLIMGDKERFPTREDFDLVCTLVTPLRNEFPGFDELEDEYDDGDADEECDEEFEYIDEPGDEYLDSDVGEFEYIDEPGDEYLDGDVD